MNILNSFGNMHFLKVDFVLIYSWIRFDDSLDLITWFMYWLSIYVVPSDTFIYKVWFIYKIPLWLVFIPHLFFSLYNLFLEINIVFKLCRRKTSQV